MQQAEFDFARATAGRAPRPQPVAAPKRPTAPVPAPGSLEQALALGYLLPRPDAWADKTLWAEIDTATTKAKVPVRLLHVDPGARPAWVLVRVNKRWELQEALVQGSGHKPGSVEPNRAGMRLYQGVVTATNRSPLPAKATAVLAGLSVSGVGQEKAPEVARALLEALVGSSILVSTHSLTSRVQPMPFRLRRLTIEPNRIHLDGGAASLEVRFTEIRNVRRSADNVLVDLWHDDHAYDPTLYVGVGSSASKSKR